MRLEDSARPNPPPLVMTHTPARIGPLIYPPTEPHVDETWRGRAVGLIDALGERCTATFLKALPGPTPTDGWYARLKVSISDSFPSGTEIEAPFAWLFALEDPWRTLHDSTSFTADDPLTRMSVERDFYKAQVEAAQMVATKEATEWTADESLDIRETPPPRSVRSVRRIVRVKQVF